jgi:phospholipid/cholesterol/gamma-HCH transport system substrate-binding protein
MITRRTKTQLIIFALITMIGVAYVGARYAHLDRLVRDDSYRVVAHFAESGGIFSGAEVSYRGVTVGQVGEMVLTDKGVDVMLDIEKGAAPIPSDTRAVIADRSAVGEQYVELQPATDAGPYLKDRSQIPVDKTTTPIAATTLLTDLDSTVNSVHKQSLRTVVSEFGKAFNGTGPDLGRIIDTSSSFIKTANDNFDLTTALIRDSNTVLQTQLDKRSAIKSFAKDLSLVSDTLVSSDADLRRVIENGSATANQLRTFLEENKVDLGQLINNLVTTGQITLDHIAGTQMLLVLYPYVVEGGYAVVAKDPQTGMYDAHFGMVLTTDPPVCHKGYEGTDTRPPQDTSDRPMNVNARCTEPQSQSSARGAQHAPRAGTAYRAPVVAAYDSKKGKLTYTNKSPSAAVTYTGGAAAAFGGEESWKWLLLQPLAGSQE